MLFDIRHEILSLDLGHARIKAMRVESAGPGKLRVMAIGSEAVPPPPDGDRDRQQGLRERMHAALENLLRRLAIHPKRERRVLSCLPANQVAIKRVACLPLPEEELRAALAFEARKHLPVEGEALMDFQILGKVGDQLDVLLVTTTREAVQRHLELLEGLGFRNDPKSLILEAPQLAALNACRRASQSVAKIAQNAAESGGGEMFACLSLGATASQIALYRSGGALLCRDIAVGGDRMSEEKRQSLGLTFDEAEARKCAEGLMPESVTPETGKTASSGLMLEAERDAVPASVSTLVREIGRTLRFVQKEDAAYRPQCLHLLGAPAADATLRSALQRELALDVVAVNPLAGFADLAKTPDHPLAFGLTAGMAWRGAHEFFPRQPE